MIDLIRFNPEPRMASVIDRGLPKWPQMRVEGVPVTIEQAKEIIRRTDRYFTNPDHAGNNDKWRDRAQRMLRIPSCDRYPDGTFMETKDLVEAWGFHQQWLTKWGYIGTEYVHNNWLASSYIYGPYGWCHPDGTIRYMDNVGKWPDGRSIYDDWKKLAIEFPFLNLICVLMSGEQCEDDTVPIMGFRVLDGVVTGFDPAESLTAEEIAGLKISRNFDEEHILSRVSNSNDRSYENGVPWSWIEEWAMRGD